MSGKGLTKCHIVGWTLSLPPCQSHTCTRTKYFIFYGEHAPNLHNLTDKSAHSQRSTTGQAVSYCVVGDFHNDTLTRPYSHTHTPTHKSEPMRLVLLYIVSRRTQAATPSEI